MSPSRPSEHGPPLLIVLSGPSGVGKDAVLSRMRDQRHPYHFTVTATTRPRRPNETDGLDYIFVSAEEFQRMIDAGELLEWAEVYGNMYGVPKSQVADALRDRRDVIIKADIQGAATIRRLAPDAVFIFLAAPSQEELARRLSLRMTESPEALRIRLETATAEMEEASRFDHVVVNRNGRLDDAISEIEEAVTTERERKPAKTWEL